MVWYGTPYDRLNKFYSCYMAVVIIIGGGCGLIVLKCIIETNLIRVSRPYLFEKLLLGYPTDWLTKYIKNSIDRSHVILPNTCLLEFNMAANGWLSVLFKNRGIVVLSAHNCVLWVDILFVYLVKPVFLFFADLATNPNF